MPALPQFRLERGSDLRRDLGQRRLPADRQVALSDAREQLLRRLTPHELAHERSDLLHGVGAAEPEQQNALA